MIGTTAAILGATLLSSAASVGGSLLTNSAASKTANANNALARDQYGQNKQTLDPFISSGREAIGQVNNFGDNVDWQAYLDANPDVLAAYKANEATYQAQGESLDAFARRHYIEHGKAEGRALPSTGTNQNLTNFQSSEGLTPLNAKVADTVGSSYQDYLDKSGVGSSIAQADALTGGSLDQYRANTGTAATNADTARFLGVGSGGEGAYLENAGLAPTNAALESSLGLNGGGYDAYLGDTKGYNDAIDKFLGIGAGGLPDFLKSTGYDFTKSQALDAATQSAAARGMLGSGGTLKALQDRAGQIASTYGQQYFGDLSATADQRTAQRAGYRNALSGYDTLRSGQAGDYLAGLTNFGNTQEGQALNYGNLVDRSASRKSATYGDYTQGVLNQLANQRAQAGDYLDFTNANANRGLTAANALAGVGTNMVGQVTQNNNNALQARAGATTSAVNGINGTIGNALATYGYLQGQKPPTTSSWYGGAGYTPFLGA